MRHVLPLLVLALTGLGAVALWAEDVPPTPTQALLAEVEAAKAAKDESAWCAAVRKVPTLYADATDADKKVLAAAAGAALKAKSETVQQAGVEALAGTKDGEAAWKAGLKSLMPDLKAESSKPIELQALAALKDLHPEAAVAPLLAVLTKAKDPLAAGAALEALGAYERSKQRVAILDEIIKTVRNARPGQSSSGQLSEPTPRWLELKDKVTPALNALTGQSEKDVDLWLKLFDEHKKKPAELFKSPLE